VATENGDHLVVYMFIDTGTLLITDSEDAARYVISAYRDSQRR
jgi:hypothetical protein